mgnify:CR=1 FL=1
MDLLFSGISHQFDGIASTLSGLFDVPNLSRASTVSLANVQTLGLRAERVMPGSFVFHWWMCSATATAAGLDVQFLRKES